MKTYLVRVYVESCTAYHVQASSAKAAVKKAEKQIEKRGTGLLPFDVAYEDEATEVLEVYADESDIVADEDLFCAAV